MAPIPDLRTAIANTPVEALAQDRRRSAIAYLRADDQLRAACDALSAARLARADHATIRQLLAAHADAETRRDVAVRELLNDTVFAEFGVDTWDRPAVAGVLRELPA